MAELVLVYGISLRVWLAGVCRAGCANPPCILIIQSLRYTYFLMGMCIVDGWGQCSCTAPSNLSFAPLAHALAATAQQQPGALGEF